jgi:hypothetical protein
MKQTCWNWDRVTKELPDTTGHLTAEKLYNAYDKVRPLSRQHKTDYITSPKLTTT